MSVDLASTPAIPEVVRRKVLWRIVPLILVLYVISYLDRANVGFAKLRMQGALGWSDEVFGIGFGIFFAGYLVLEIPGALLVEYWSARKWFARILVTWGICSMGMALVSEPWQFYLARFLLGLAEAGFFPGVIVYFTHWFPRAERARALSGLVLGVPVSLALGAQVSGVIMEQNWLEIDGWKWVFLIEGAPAVLAGVAVPFLLTDRPAHARWLTPMERTWLEQTLQQERLDAAANHLSMGQALRQPAVWLLSLGILATNTGGYAMGFWMPTVMENLLKVENPDSSPAETLRLIGLVYLCGLAGVLISGQSSDRTGDRKWHCVAGQVLTGVFLAASVIPGQSFDMVFVWLCCMGFCAFFWPSPFWVLPTLSLSASAVPVAVGIINICANVAGLLGSPIVGRMKDQGFTDQTCLLFLSCCYATGGIFIASLCVKSKLSPVQSPVSPSTMAS